MLALGLAAMAVIGVFVAADAAVSMLALPLPGSLVAMLCVFVYCVALGRIPAALDALARRALAWLPLYFVPACTLALLDLGRMTEGPLAIALVVTAGTVLTAAVTAAGARTRESAPDSVTEPEPGP